MAHTWSNDDDILVIDLYLRHGAVLSVESTEISTVARLIGTTADSVYTALSNVDHLATGRGLPNAAEHMRRMWESWGDRPEDTRRAAESIRKRIEEEARGRPLPDLTEAQRAAIAARRAERRRGR